MSISTPTPQKKSRKKPCMVYSLSQWSHKCLRVWDVTMLPHMLFLYTHCSSFDCSAVSQKPTIGIMRIGTLDGERAMHRQGQAHYTLQPKSAARMLGRMREMSQKGPGVPGQPGQEWWWPCREPPLPTPGTVSGGLEWDPVRGERK